MQDIRELIRVEFAGVLQRDNKAGVPFGLAWPSDRMKDLGQSSQQHQGSYRNRVSDGRLSKCLSYLPPSSNKVSLATDALSGNGIKGRHKRMSGGNI